MAAIDTLAQEPPGIHPMLSSWRAREDWLARRLVITPYNAVYSDHAAVEMCRNAGRSGSCCKRGGCAIVSSADVTPV